MKISRTWLQRFFETPLPESAALAHALTFHAFEIESVENDVLDVKVTANRGHDCLSHRGIAKELSAILRLPMKEEVYALTEDNLKKTAENISVRIENADLCPRYIAGFIHDVTVGPSPEWLVKSLEVLGQRSVNSVVDATNFVMFNIGQPLHAFDAAQLKQADGAYAISVRAARPGEKMVALDDKEYTLQNSVLVIADVHADVPVGIAGIKGGKPAGVSVETKNIIIESANFNGVSVRKSAQALKLRTDASARFEQVISPELAGEGMRAVVGLIQELAGGDIAGFVDEYPRREERRTVSVTGAMTNAVLGTKLEESDVEDAFRRLGFSFENSAGNFTVTPPPERLDILIPEDLIEEVGRIIGYDSVPAIPLSDFPHKPAVNQNFYWQERVRQLLIAEGFSEIYSPVFTSEGEEAVLNKVESDTPYLRRELLGGLRSALDKNVRNKDVLGQKQIRLFEMGTVWRGGAESTFLCVAVEKVKKQKTAQEYLREVGEKLGVTIADTLADEVLEIPLDDIIAKLPDVGAYEDLPAISDIRYRTFSRYPFIVRDIALWAPAAASETDIADVIRTHAGDLLVRLDLFDRFEKDGKVSFAFRLVFQSFDKTLTDGDANERMESIYAAMKEREWEVR
ncbi:phenylalanine--tRNA ligase subunit beta [Candidatus Kaiserbacteria bacterium]|nr:phenylalanine--tRNA ligase subunit beta [Candidatus Kaiserbacteria bacterium]